jgi:hypothetical protein
MSKIARIVVRGWPSADPLSALRQAFANWPHGAQAQYLITPGGFVTCRWPRNWVGPRGWASRESNLSALADIGTPTVEQLLTPDVLKSASGKIDYITIGVDVRSETTSTHAELIALVEVATAKIIGWTGKSFPTPGQERTLVHVADPASHLFQVGQERLVILGCHDLNIFNGRSRANQLPGGNRETRCRELLSVISDFRPSCIVQHAHATDTWRTWVTPWAEVAHRFPDASWASAIAYAPKRTPECRAPLVDVLWRTHHEGAAALNLFINGNAEPSSTQARSVP